MIRKLPSKPRRFFDLFEEFGTGSVSRLPKHVNGGFELHYIEKGHLHWEIEGRPFLVPPRSVFFTFPWEKHGGCGDFEPGHYFHFAVFRVQNPGVKPAKTIRLVPGFDLTQSEQDRIFRKLLLNRNRCLAATPDLAMLITKLVRELTEPGAMAPTAVIALSQAVLCELATIAHFSHVHPTRSSPGSQKVSKFVDELRLNCSENWTLEAMAAACNLKRTHFESLTKELTGDTPLLLLNRYRIRRAQHLIKTTHRALTEIAFEVGYESSQYFSRVFFKLNGTTPSQYRKNHGNLPDYDQRFQKALSRLRRQA